jgi:hemolysin activation/secretion protein
MQGSSASQIQTQRFLNGLKLNESRVGGSGHLEWRPFRDLGGTALALYLDANHQSVSLERSTGTVLKQNLNDIELGGFLISRSIGSQHPWKTRVEPLLTLGVGPAFQRFRIAANTHRAFDTFQCDLTGRFEGATRDTPIYEMPSLGGSDTVRGFRADDAVGQRLWSVQSELWRPIPGLDPSHFSNAQIQALLQGLRLSPFLDLGGAYQTTASRPGLRAGAGLGLRLDLHLAVLKFDWAYGFGDAATGGSRGKFYFSAGLNLPQ